MRFSNRGTDEAGPNFVLGQVMANGLLGGQTNLGAMFGAATDYDEYHGLGVLANVGVGTAGSRLSFSGFRSRSDPNEAVVDRDDSYLRDRASIAFTRPLPAFERARSVAVRGARLRRPRDPALGERLRDERLRMLTVGSRWSWRQGRRRSTWPPSSSSKVSTPSAAVSPRSISSDDPRRADFTLTPPDLHAPPPR